MVRFLCRLFLWRSPHVSNTDKTSGQGAAAAIGRLCKNKAIIRSIRRIGRAVGRSGLRTQGCRYYGPMIRLGGTSTVAAKLATGGMAAVARAAKPSEATLSLFGSSSGSGTSCCLKHGSHRTVEKGKTLRLCISRLRLEKACARVEATQVRFCYVRLIEGGAAWSHPSGRSLGSGAYRRRMQ